MITLSFPPLLVNSLNSFSKIIIPLNLIKETKGIILEVSVAVNEYNFNAPKSTEIFDFMFNLGFEHKIVVGYNFNPDNGELVQEDYLFLNKNFIEYEE